MKIIVRQISGLGNQMFQYAAGLYYARQYNAQMRMGIDPPQNAVSYGHPRPFLLSHFAISAQHRELNRLERLMLLTEHRHLKPFAGAILQHGIFQHGLHLQIVAESVEQRFRFQPVLPIGVKTETIYLVGYWQVYNIAERIAIDLKKEFSFREAPTGKNLEVLRLIQNTENSVSLHIRRGDYTLAAEGNIALPMEYYARAIAHIKGCVSKPTFFIFSDDIEFAKTKLGSEIAASFIDHNDSFSAHEDLRLMSSCRHHIIANSTFSWWGAWLSASANKMVFAPRNWMVGNCPHDNDLFPPSWRLLDGTP
ncbi:MAG TPA: alpha-1,2-fucosyltransferase [Steroidobacteraceae bacterium]